MKYPFVISIPHCSSRVPPEIRARMALSDEEILDAEDFGTAEIFESLPAKRIITAQWSRLVADLNRAPENTGSKGIVAETDYRGRQVYLPGDFPDPEEIEERIKKYYLPYHEKLAAALQEPGIKGLFDCHSLNGTGPQDAPDAGKKRKDIILGNNGAKNGKADPGLGEPTCPAEIMTLVRSALEDQGFSVAVNDPYRGGYITVHYGRLITARGGFAVQIEMNQDLYINQGAHAPDPERIKEVRKKIFSVFEKLAEFLKQGGGG